MPGDKSISHRALLLAAMAAGSSRIADLSTAGDCDRTVSVVRALGARIDQGPGEVAISAGGVSHLMPADGLLDCGRSGTTMRLAMGLLAGLPYVARLTGDPHLLRRPMDRVAHPLRSMGATVELTDGTAPLSIRGGELHGIRYEAPVASAQVKSALLLAGIQSSGTTTVIEPVATRDHTERLLAAMGATIEVATDPGGPGACASVRRSELEPLDVRLPGDLSSAAPLIAAATLLRRSDVIVEGVGLNPTRTGFLRILSRMRGRVEILDVDDGIEPRGSIRARHSDLEAVVVDPWEVPAVIDELPLIGVLATQAVGTTEVHGAAELRVKESDRISGLVTGLRALGAEADALPDGFAVRGPTTLRGSEVDARRDHRLAMAFLVAGLIAEPAVVVEGREFIRDSFPGFEEQLEHLQ